MRNELPILAICYDFDKTLTPDDMQAQGYIQSVGYDVEKFWGESNGLAKDNEMDQNLAYMYVMKREAEGKLLFTRKTLEEAGKGIQLFPGVKEWFDRIRKYGDENGVVVEHYVISSGLKEMIDATAIARDGAFKKVYANSFYYNLKGVAEWPAQIVNYTNKTQFLFRISKGCLDINDPRINEYYPPEKIRVPFRNIVYIGDSDTDIPCMKLVNSNGGHSIGVFNPRTADKTKVYKMMHDKRIRYFVPADYSVDSELDVLLRSIIVKTSAQERLNQISQEHSREAKNYNESIEFEKNFKWIESFSKARNLTVGELILQLRDKRLLTDTAQG